MAKPVTTISCLQIGITDHCNLHCHHCDRTRLFSGEKQKNSPTTQRTPGFMEHQLFDKLVDDLCNQQIFAENIFLAWIGESLLHPDFFKMLEYLFQKNEEFKFTNVISLTTNGSLFSTVFIDKFIHLALKYRQSRLHLTFSLDAWHQSTFNELGKKLDSDKVKKNIVYFLEKNSQQQAITFNLDFLALAKNQKDLSIFFTEWETICKNFNYPIRKSSSDMQVDEIPNLLVVKKAAEIDQPKSNGRFTDFSKQLNLLPEATEILNSTAVVTSKYQPSHRFKDQSHRLPCPAPFYYPVIHHDGQVTVCCHDIHLQLSVGNIAQKSFHEIWTTSEPLRKIRQFHLSKKFACLTPCVFCHNHQVPALTDHQINEEMKKVYTEAAVLQDTRVGMQSTMDIARDFINYNPDQISILKETAEVLFTEKQFSEAEQLMILYHDSISACLKNCPPKIRDSIFIKYFTEEIHNIAKKIENNYLPSLSVNNIRSFLEELSLAKLLATAISDLDDSTIDIARAEHVRRNYLKNSTLYRSAGEKLFQQAHYSEARACFLAQLEIFDKDLPSFKGMAFSSYQLGEKGQSELWCNEFLQESADGEISFLLGQLLLEKSFFSEALVHLENALCELPHSIALQNSFIHCQECIKKSSPENQF